MHNKETYMTKEYIDLIYQNMDNILSIHNETKYAIAYFGGEPLLNWEVLKYSSQKFRQDPRLEGLYMFSNLTLLDEEKVDFIISNDIVPLWSFDGLWQDNNRPLKNSKSSLDLYLKKKHLIDKLNLKFVSVVINPKNSAELAENLEYLLNTWNVRPRFGIERDYISWTQVDIDNLAIGLSKLSNKYIELIKQDHSFINNSFFSYYVRAVYKAEKYGKTWYACDAKYTSPAIFPDGFVYPCATFGTNKKLPLFDYRNNIIYKENIHFLKESPETTQTYFNDKCKNCNYFQFCHGGCLYINLYKKDPIEPFCKIQKLIINESIRFYEMLKDMKLDYLLNFKL
jgi:radical SAM protein with 4Fe4S-binding SPASM domain